MRSGISAAEASRIILETTPRLGAEIVAVTEALGRVLAEPVVSGRVLPPADNSAMDGYALRAADTVTAAADRPGALRVVYEVAAGGAAPRPLAAGEAARIFTGAPTPPGCDAVVRQEDAEREGDRIELRAPVPVGQNVRRAGEDVQEGERVLEPGVRIGPGPLGLLTSLGRSFVAVHRRPRVAVLSGGDELVEPDGDVRGGRIVSSNSYSISAQCREIGAEPSYLGIARDAPEDIERRLRGGLSADVIVSSAGVSVGDRDYVRGVLEKLGCRMHFWGVNIKPGYPLAFGQLGPDAAGEPGPLVFALPGNPVSAMVTFEQFARPALLKMAGHVRLHRPTLRAVLGETLRKAEGRMHFVRVRLARDGDAVRAAPTGSQSSGVLKSMAQADGLLIFPAQATELVAGAEVTVQVLDEGFLASDTPGF